MDRRDFLKASAAGAGVAAAGVRPLAGGARAEPATSEASELPLVDLHVHLTKEFPIERMVKIAQERSVTFGILEHPAPWAIKDDADLRRHVAGLRPYPVYVGLQPMEPGWDKGFSAEALADLDYVLMDPQSVPLPGGGYQRIWELQTYVEDTDEFMARYMAHCLHVLEHEPIQVFGWPLFLPVCIARDYYSLWTQERMQALVSAAKARTIAIEINDMSHTPDERFIRMAKGQGLKFTFGSDARNEDAGRLSYCKAVARKCGLTAADFFVPRRKAGAPLGPSTRRPER
jgi:histidinol phosphatase-like PHP family hydrolase